jgi:hypothetical protein
MAISTYCRTDDIIEIDDFVEYVESEVDLDEDDSLVGAATMLQALANNKKALVEIFNHDLLKYDINASVSYSQSSSVLAVGRYKNFIVRANMWPPDKAGTMRAVEDTLFSYELPHNHNFSFLTANYFGPGYVTDIWECTDFETIRGICGENISLRFIERTRLEPGKQMFFRRQRDIHIQHPPEEFSVSVNLLPISRQNCIIDQFEFDIKNSRISGFPNGSLCSKRVFLMEVAGKIGDQNTADILLKISKNHPCHRTRGAALSSALNIIPPSALMLDKNIKDDNSPIIQEILRSKI